MRRTTHRILHRLEQRVDRRLGGRLRRPGEVIITPYRGFGRSGELLVRGRVLADKRIARVEGAEPVWRNLANTYRRFQSDEVPGARVVARFRTCVTEGTSDEEGHFLLRIPCDEPLGDALWHEVRLELPDTDHAGLTHVVVPPAGAQFGIISDIDDTIVETNATSLVKMARAVFLNNASMRTAFEGVSELYRELHRDVNPIFYVSSSPWNLYELLHEFMDLKAIPHGPMFLQDWGIDATKLFKTSHLTHKMLQIRTLLEYYPHLPFVLIGDSGQHDPEVYLDVIRAFPGRVRGVFIRDVSGDVRDHSVARLVHEAGAAGVEMIRVPDSSAAMVHARRMGLVPDGRDAAERGR
ncbi:MAG: phosphatase domain-containing protein [Thermoanaerobaculia bacterium]